MPFFLVSGSWTPDIRIDGRRRFRWGLRRRRPPPIGGRRSGSHVYGRAAAECPRQVRAEEPGHLNRRTGRPRLSVRGPASVASRLGVRPYSRRIIRIETIPRQVFKKDLRGRLLRGHAPFSQNGDEICRRIIICDAEGADDPRPSSGPSVVRRSSPPFREMSFPTQE